MEQSSSLTRGQVARSLRAFITASGLWGVWGQAMGVGTAVFAGYLLLLGIDESVVPIFASISYLLALTQLAFPLLGRRIGNTKGFIIKAGFGEILCRGSLILVPFLFAPSLYLGALLALTSLGLLWGYAASPFYSTWLANTIPPHTRARFTSRQTIVSTLVAMAAGFLIGQFIDLFPAEGRQQAFVSVFLVGTLFGLLGYAVLARAPMPPPAAEEDSAPSVEMLIQPLRDRRFRRAVLFFGLWTFATGLAGPLYSVFMLQRLHISYTEISIFSALSMVTSIVGYRLWAELADRFGSKPVLQILLVPSALLPLAWILSEPGSYYLVPVAMGLGGFLFAGIAVSTRPMVYGLLPGGDRRPFYMACWSASVSLLGALGPLGGSLLARYLQDTQFELAGLSLGNLQLIFALSAVCRLVPVFLLRFVDEAKGISSRHLLSQMFSGNLVSYTYNAAMYNLFSAEERRARATLGLGRSGNPLAVEQLIQALADASPKVRRSAARALGESGLEEAAESLVRELLNGESDIRGEAAEALGRLGHAGSIDPLIEAMEDQDPRVRISAIRGLAAMKGDEAQELIFWYFSEAFDPRTFPTLVDVLSEMGDRRIVKPTLQHLEEFRSPAIQLQLLNSVCRALGAGDQFYRLLSHEDMALPGEIGRLLKRASSTLNSSRVLDTEVRQELRQYFQRLIQAYEDENTEWMIESVRQLAGALRDGLSTPGQPPYEVLSVYVAIVALNSFLAATRVREEQPRVQDIFLAVCLSRLAVLVRAMDS